MKAYFLQTNEWTNFWIESGGIHHNIHFFSHKNNGITIWAHVYEYPWHLGKSFLYIPKGPVFSIDKGVFHEKVIQEYSIFLDKIIKFATSQNITFIKLDFDYRFTNLVDISDNNQLRLFLSSLCKQTVVLSKKPLQYLSTMILDCHSLQYTNKIEELMEINNDFWSKTNENIRRYTRKSLKQDWKIETNKTKQNFENFWIVYKSTADRQGFAIHPKSYFEKLLEYDFVRLIVLKDSKNVPHSVWFGVKIEDTLYYLYGGNDDYSFNHYGQYFIHLVATQIAAKELVKHYDLGGYDKSKGFGKFKEGYRGKIVDFLGPIDIILKPLSYYSIHTIVNSVKFLKK